MADGEYRARTDRPEQDIAVARAAGADDEAVQDTVLIAAACCMFNCYVDGLAAVTPEDPEIHDGIGATLVARGYLPQGRPASCDVAK
ncbi:hypothetical protein [Streptomyces sp. NPDC002232]|uniref:hypothetical protein n=1 Tax=Streptomyces sp. NPDC002232 TaxID=3364640 RepID=UPI00369DF34D